MTGLQRRAVLVVLLVLGNACQGKPCALDPTFDDATCAALTAMKLPDQLPLSPTNAHADDRAAAVMGFQIFFDARFSGPKTVRCASCHAPESSFHDRKPVAVALDKGTRNSPSTINTAWQSRLFWDGRVDVLWAQPIGAMENPAEMDFSRLELAHRIHESYKEQYEALFGALPDLANTDRFPLTGKPGDPAYDQMAPLDREVIDRVTVNVGKVMEAYLRKQATGAAPFDYYLGGDKTALTANQQLGMFLFVKHGCDSCHSGPLLSDEKFHNLGVPAWEGVEPDPGRAEGVLREQQATFNGASVYADEKVDYTTPATSPADLGAFRTPTLRNVSLTAPYMHNGRFETLAEVIDFHAQGGGTDGFLGTVDPLLKKQAMSPEDRDAIVAFLESLEGKYAEMPWADWPDTP